MSAARPLPEPAIDTDAPVPVPSSMVVPSPVLVDPFDVDSFDVDSSPSLLPSVARLALRSLRQAPSVRPARIADTMGVRGMGRIVSACPLPRARAWLAGIEQRRPTTPGVQPARRYATLPATMVISTSVPRICSSGTVMMSRDSTTRSAYLPGVSEPLTFSSKAANALAIV